jgi:hypothetical protein
MLTVCSLWLGWEMNFIHRRRAAVSALRFPDGSAHRQAAAFGDDLFQPARIPFWRRLLGDEAIRTIGVHPNSSESRIQALQQLFPEAQVIRRTYLLHQQ